MYIPVHLCAYMLKKKLVSQFKLYVYLKYKSNNGKLRVIKEDRIAIANILNINEKTIAVQLKSLIELNWISKSNGNIYYIRGWNLLYSVTSDYKAIFYKTRVEFSFKYFNSFREYLAGAVFCYFINDQKRKKYNKEGLKNASSIQSIVHFPLALIAMNKILNVGMSTLQKYRAEAARESYILFTGESVESQSIPSHHRARIKKYYPEIADKIVTRENNLCIQKPNCYDSNLHFKSGRFDGT